MHLQLSGRPPVAFQDGSGSWDASAADALSLWNQYIDMVKFVQAAPVNPWGGDGLNSVFFSTTVYGETFPSSALAVTVNYSDGGSGVFTETDVVFNNNIKWNSYRGPIQGTGASATYDFHRVALHEFGHVLGLDHPDQHGQNVTALMNSIISNLDHLSDDDIAGGRLLYGVTITSNLFPPSVNVGQSFSYQITANNTPSSFEANSLPPGLQLDGSSGLISGTPTSSGTFNVTLVARGSAKDASAVLRIVVIGPTLTSPLFANAEVEQSFRYQISFSTSASSFGTVGLPPGLSLDAASGLITGIPTAVGPFDVTVTAQTVFGGATGTVRIVVSPPRITSNTSPPAAEIGGNFSYQITASVQATTFTATDLPAGLQINPDTGVISGTPTLSGLYQVTVTAHTAYGNASATLQINVAKAPLWDPPVAKFPVSYIYALVADPHRPRIYAATGQSIVVIDTQSLSVLTTIALPFSPWDISVSSDGRMLWIATNSTTLGRVDLEGLTLLPSLTIAEGANKVREGLDQRLYISSTGSGAAQIDGVSGGLQARFIRTPKALLPNA